MSSLSDPFVAFFLRSLLWLVRLLRFPRALGQYTAPKRRIEIDVMKLYVPPPLPPDLRLTCTPLAALLVIRALHLFPQMTVRSFWTSKIEWMTVE